MSSNVEADALVRTTADLTHHDPAKRRAAAEALGAIGEGASAHASALANVLTDEHWSVRVAAAEALGRLGLAVGARYVNSLRERLQDADWAVRSAAAASLALIFGYDGSMADGAEECGGDGTITPRRRDAAAAALAVLLSDESDDVRVAAQNALVALGAGAVPHVLPCLAAESKESRCAAAELLIKLASAYPVAASAAAEPLAACLSDDAGSVRSAAAAALSKLGPPGAEVAAKRLQDGDDDVRLRSVDILATIGEGAAAHAVELAQLLEDEDPELRRASAEALGELGSAAVTPYAQMLAARLRDEDEDVCAAAAAALGRLGTAAAPFASELAACMGNEREQVHDLAVAALGRAGEVAAPRIAACLGDQRPEVRAAAARALGDVGAGGAAHAAELAERLRDSCVTVRLAAVEALREMGADACAPHAHALVLCLEDGDARVRRVAARSLGSLGLNHSSVACEHGLKLAALLRMDPAADVRWACARALTELGPNESLRHMRSFIDRCADTDWSVRAAVISALGSLGCVPVIERHRLDEVVTILATALRDDAHPEVRRASALALGALGSEAGSCADALSTCACQDSDDRVRRAAAKAVPMVLGMAQSAEDESDQEDDADPLDLLEDDSGDLLPL
eukprot:TRINITY_DN37675_c0_g1_i1.p1 TRINITY_DN37675_c0_g1~~TRINITY_DN37675_c0_g1_i1.p1  ORF type:complete len:631 (-),score=150.59 TRINITY_DN37675_c0_g1_i1:85-1977(-)